MPTNNPRTSITIPQEMMDRIDDYRFENKIKSQTKAIINLIELGLQSLGKLKLVPPPIELSKNDIQLLDAYHAAITVARNIALQALLDNPAEEKENRA